MRLFLSSEGFGRYPEILRELVGENPRVLFINNAKDGLFAAERAQNSAEKQAEFEENGFEFEELDLRDYFKDSGGLATRLQEAGLVWCAGGNTFILRRAFAQSGLDKLLVPLLQDNRLAYGGSSAGTVVATPSLHGAEMGDNPDLLPEGYDKEIIWRGLNLIPFHIVPHFRSGWFGAEADAMVEQLQAKSLPYEVLMDGQVVLVDGDRQETLV